MSSPSKNNLPTLLVIASSQEEDWVQLCSEYLSKFQVIQTTWDRISLSSYSDSKYPVISINPNKYSFIGENNEAISDVKPDLLLIRNFARYIGGTLDTASDFRNLLYGFYHANVPMINELEAVMAEIEKPIMYGRLRKIRDKYGEENFPLIQQNYYPIFSEICITPPAPYVIKSSYPHAGYGKIRVKDYHDLDDIRSILALHKDYSAIEPLIDVDYEFRIVFIAPNYYHVHKRRSLNFKVFWKVNCGMSNITEECKMEPRWKKWIDLIYETYPDMLTFDIDGIVDKKGKEYILEVNGSSQGFNPEHGKQDLEHLRDLVIRKLEVILGQDMLSQDNEAKELFKEKDDKNKILEKDYQKDTEIVNLKNLADDYKKELDLYKWKNQKLLKDINAYNNKTIITIILFNIGFIILFLCIYFYKK